MDFNHWLFKDSKDSHTIEMENGSITIKYDDSGELVISIKHKDGYVDNSKSFLEDDLTKKIILK